MSSHRLWASATLLGLAVASMMNLRAASEQVTVAGGTLEGAVDAGVSSFKGIPFAAPPIGANVPPSQIASPYA